MGRGTYQSSRSGRSQPSRQQQPHIPALPGGSDACDSTESSYDNYHREIRADHSRSSGSFSGRNSSRSRSPRGRRRERSFSSQNSVISLQKNQSFDHRQQYYNERAVRLLGDESANGEPPPLLEVPEEIYAVRKAALTVLQPLTHAWLIFAIGFSSSVALGMSRWTALLPELPFWFIFLPSWLSHAGLLCCHVLSARALSTFIAEANENRQRQDTTDHLDRTEYLPLLQRSLKFGLKTGILSFLFFLFEVLMYLRLSRGSISLTAALIPLWIIVVGGILDGIVCKTQHVIRLLCWVLTFVTMVLAVIKVDYELASMRWRVVFSPIVALLSISSATLIYIVYGHQVGYFRLTEAQLTAGILYSMSALVCTVLVVVLGEVIPLDRPVEVETKLFVVTLAPLTVALVGVGAWAVTRDEFDRLLQVGGQSTVYPMKLRLEPAGWTSVESRGVSIIPMFGDVSYEPLDSAKSESIELCACCACYPFEEEEETVQYSEPRNINTHPFSSSASSQNSKQGRL